MGWIRPDAGGMRWTGRRLVGQRRAASGMTPTRAHKSPPCARVGPLLVHDLGNITSCLEASAVPGAAARAATDRTFVHQRTDADDRAPAFGGAGSDRRSSMNGGCPGAGSVRTGAPGPTVPSAGVRVRGRRS
jgi:hypothetical protein